MVIGQGVCKGRARGEHMQTIDADVGIIGGGPGGYVAAVRAATLGKSVVLVEMDRLGGVCLNRGCIPTKALITTARALETARKGARLGLAGDLSIDQPASVKRARAVAERMSKGVAHLMKARSIQVIRGRGRLTGPGRIVVDDGTEVQAGAVILATGGAPRPLPGCPFDGTRVLSSTEAMWLEEVPRSLVVVGGGAIGMEFAYYYSVAGSRVTVVEALDSILPFADPEAVKLVERAMRRRKVKMLAKARVASAGASESGVELVIERQGEQETLEAERMLVAIGVAPHTRDLWADELSLETSGPFVRVDAHMRTSLAGVYAIGDLAGPPLLAHAASEEGIVAAEHIAGLGSRRKDHLRVPAVVYCQPQLAQVGLSESQAVSRGLSVVVGRYPFLASGMAQAAGESDGVVKLVFDEGSGALLGGVVCGAEASELVSELSLALEAGLRHEDLAGAVHPHPTFSEAIFEAASQACGRPIHTI
jgi:dihydrolipoamide dehydrogenase